MYTLFVAFYIVTIQQLNQSVAAVLHILEFDKFQFAICILIDLILYLFDRYSIFLNKLYKISIIICKLYKFT